MRTYLENKITITSLMAFIAALLVSMSFATAGNAVVLPGNAVIGNPMAVNAVVPPVGVKAVNAIVNPAFNRPSDIGVGVRPFGLGFGLGVRPFGFGVNPFFRPFGFGFNPFFNADFDAVGFGFGVGD